MDLETNRVACGDCLKLMAELPSNSIDLIVTDPPYEIVNMEGYFAAMARVLNDKTGSFYCFGDKDIVAEHWFAQTPFPNKTLLVWYYKNSPKPRGRWRLSFQALIYAFYKKASFHEDAIRIPYTEGAKKLNGRLRPSNGRLAESKSYDTSRGALPRDVIEVPALLGHRASERFGHPDQKPEELIEKLILASSEPGDLVLDPFGGTGTVALVAKRLGRKYLTFERDEGWVQVIAERLEFPR